LRSSLLGQGSGVVVVVEADRLSIAADHAVPIGLLVNELVTNAIKYAFPAGKGRISIGFRRQDGHVVLTVADDGIGMGSTIGGSGMGARFIEAFVSQIGGSLAQASGPTGTTVSVRLPRKVLA
jgi:two-component sensor histidine kinase